MQHFEILRLMEVVYRLMLKGRRLIARQTTPYRCELVLPPILDDKMKMHKYGVWS